MRRLRRCAFLPIIPFVVWVLLFTAGITLINARGIRFMARANTLLMAVMTFCAVKFVVLAARQVIAQDGAGGLLTIRGLLQPGTFALQAVMLGASIATLSYIRFDAISMLAEDTLHPQRDIGFATVFVCIL
jgi:amino acid transporter